MKKSLLMGAALTVLALCAPASAELKFKPGEDPKFNWANFEELKKVDLKGETLSVFGPWRGPDEVQFQSVLEYFREATGATVNYSSSENYEQQIVIDTQAGSPPNIAILPQPGLIQDLASKGMLVALDDATATFVKDNYGAGESWVDLGTYKDKDGAAKFFAYPWKQDLKSMVWYVPENFEENDYKVPETWEDMMKLSDQIIADGGVPWCIGLGSGGATGWPATDWVEDILLRTAKPDVYVKWTKNEIPFNDPQVVNALTIFNDIVQNPKMVDGGTAAVAATDFRDSSKGLFGVPPKCYMHRMASFIPSFFPEGTKLGEDADFFYLPPMAAHADLGKPVLGAGTFAMIAKDSKAARAFVEFLKMPLSHELWMAQSGFLSALKTTKPEAYANDILRREGEVLLNASTFGFDGSDLMPGKIGAGAFWTGMIDMVGGKAPDAVAADIQKTWDGLK